MSTPAVSLTRRFAQADGHAAAATEPHSENVAGSPGHNGELAFRNHVVAVYMGYMATTILFCALYMIPVWIYSHL